MKRSREQWLDLFQSHEASGLSQAQFCKRHQLCPKYFSLRKRQLAKGNQVSSFVKVQNNAINPAADIRLCYRGIELYIPAGSISCIAALVKALT